MELKNGSLGQSTVCRKPRIASDNLQLDDAMRENKMVMAARALQ